MVLLKEREHHVCLFQLECVVCELIEQLAVACTNFCASILYTQRLQPSGMAHRST